MSLRPGGFGGLDVWCASRLRWPPSSGRKRASIPLRTMWGTSSCDEVAAFAFAEGVEVGRNIVSLPSLRAAGPTNMVNTVSRERAHLREFGAFRRW